MTHETNASKIRTEIGARFQKAVKNGFSSVEIRASDLHDSVKFNEGSHPNQMPNVCNMMHEVLRQDDKIAHEPPKGRGGKLTIIYQVPR